MGGTTFSIWDMQEIEEARQQGTEVPPTYINITDAVSFLFCLLFRATWEILLRMDESPDSVAGSEIGISPADSCPKDHQQQV